MTKYIYLFFDLVLLILSSLKSLIVYFTDPHHKIKINREKKCIILANGPSLKKDLPCILEQAETSEFYVLNYFAYDDSFYKLKPRFYTLCDPIFWKSGLNVDVEQDNALLFERLLSVDWEMYLICMSAGKRKISSLLNANKNIKIISVRPVWFDIKSESIINFLYKYKLARPKFINVAVLALWHSINNGNTHIQIYGADFSFFKDFYVDPNTNNVYSSFSHFSLNTVGQDNAYNKYKDNRRKKMHQRLHQAYSAFYQMYLLSRYAKSINVSIVNRSTDSYIDCFDRV